MLHFLKMIFVLNIMFNHRFVTRFRHKHINVKKMTIVLFALKKWFFILQKCHFTIYGDNFVVVSNFQKRFIHDSIMISLRDICMFLIKHDIIIVSLWIFTKQNTLVDLLSREKYAKIVDIYSQLRKWMIFHFHDTIKRI